MWENRIQKPINYSLYFRLKSNFVFLQRDEYQSQMMIEIKYLGKMYSTEESFKYQI